MFAGGLMTFASAASSTNQSLTNIAKQPASDLLGQCGVSVTPTPVSEILDILRAMPAATFIVQVAADRVRPAGVRQP